MIRVKEYVIFISLTCLFSCAGSSEGENNKSGDDASVVSKLKNFDEATFEFSDKGNISLETVVEMSRGYAPWEPGDEIHNETRRFVNWLDRRNVPLSSTKQIVNWMQFTLEFSKYTDSCYTHDTCSHDGLLSGYYMGLASVVIDSKRKGRETITPSPMSGNGMLVSDTVDLMHGYYLESGIWSKAEYELIESLRAQFEKIEVVPGNLSQSLDENVLRICQTTTDSVTHEVRGPCTTIHID